MARRMKDMTKSERKEYQRLFDMTGVAPDKSEYSNRRGTSPQG